MTTNHDARSENVMKFCIREGDSTGENEDGGDDKYTDTTINIYNNSNVNYDTKGVK